MDGKNAFRWYLITHNYQAYQLVSEKVDALGIEMYSPAKYTVTRRSDGSGQRTRRTQLFPGYVFLRLSVEQIHLISTLTGVKEFVRFGTDICTVSDSLIEALKQSLLLRADKKVTQIEFSNIPTELVKSLEAISLISGQLARQSAFLLLLQQDVSVQKGMMIKNSCVSSVIEHPFVNDLIN